MAKARGAKREKLLERAASKIVKLDKAASQQTVKRQKRRDTTLANAEKITATNKRAVRQERPQEFTALFIAKVQADVARGTMANIKPCWIIWRILMIHTMSYCAVRQMLKVRVSGNKRLD